MNEPLVLEEHQLPRKCKDCGTVFTPPAFRDYKKCIHCQERDDCYRERGRRE